MKDFAAAVRLLDNPADDIAWFRVLRLHEGIGPVLARPGHRRAAADRAGPLERWPDAADCLPPRIRPAVSATVDRLIAAAGLERTADRAGIILSALHDPVSARYADAGARLADLQRLADAAASRPSLHEALVELTLDPPASGSDLAGRPRIDDDFLIISTIHSAKGLEWPVVHLPQLVDGFVPSDMALSTPAGEAEEHRLFYVAVTRARDQLYLYAPIQPPREEAVRARANEAHAHTRLPAGNRPAGVALRSEAEGVAVDLRLEESGLRDRRQQGIRRACVAEHLAQGTTWSSPPTAELLEAAAGKIAAETGRAVLLAGDMT